ncbi:MAG: superoxide dismutase family protein [Acidobacteria bacterium]|nr:superoxide dismutase family protein [Acidobacteriota bacterium]
MKKTLMVLVSSVFLAACASSSGNGPMAMTMLAPAAAGSTAQGMVHFQQQADGSVEVTADLTGVPAGTHGFHVHDKGDCGDSGNAAGGHYNPMNMSHGAPDAAAHHAGDFGNVTADASGEVHAKFNTRSITVAAGSTSVVNHAVILHANADDLTTQPTGNAGARIACGVVTLHQMGGGM